MTSSLPSLFSPADTGFHPPSVMLSERTLSRFTLGAGIFAVLGGLLTLIGWFAPVNALTDWAHSGIPMFANTALAAALLGASLIAAALGRRRLSIALAFPAAAIGGLSLIEHIAGVSLGIDNLLVAHPVTRAAAAPGRMGPPACVSYLLLGTGLIFAGLNPRTRAWAATPALVVAAISALSLTGYAFGADTLFAAAKYTGIAFQTAIMVFSLALGLLAALPDQQPVAALRRDDPGGDMLRRSLLPTIALILLIGWFRVLGQEYGFYDTAFGSAASALAKIILIIALLWWIAGSLSAASVEVYLARAKLRTIIDAAPMGIYLAVGDDLIIRHVNPIAMPAFGLITDPVGRKLEAVLRSIWPADVAQQQIDVFRLTYQTGEPTIAPEVISQRADGMGYGYYNWQVHRVAIPGGGYGVVCYFLDITEQVRAREALVQRERLLTTVTEQTHVGLVIINHHHRYLYANRAYAHILGLPSHQIVGRRVADVLPAVYASQIRPRLERAFLGEYVEYELNLPPLPDTVHPDAPPGSGDRCFSVTYQPQTSVGGTVENVVVAITDIAEVRRAQAQRQPQARSGMPSTNSPPSAPA